MTKIHSVAELQEAIRSNRVALRQYFANHHQRDICYRMMEHFSTTGRVLACQEAQGFMYAVVDWLNEFTDTPVAQSFWNKYNQDMS